METTSKSREEQRTRIVVLIAFIMMIAEIVGGMAEKSMALLADGIHQGTHVLVLGISWYAYVLVRRLRAKDDKRYNRRRILALSGYTSGLLLLVFAILVGIEATERLFQPEVQIHYTEALAIAVVGLAVNSVCAWLLHSQHGESDINSRSAYLHVLSDALTGVGAIVGLLCAMLWGVNSIDAIVALASALVIMRWAIGVLREASRELVSTR